MIAHAHNMNGRMAEWKNRRMAGWQNGRMEEWQDGRMEEWKNGRIAGWQDGRMEWPFSATVQLGYATAGNEASQPAISRVQVSLPDQ